MLEDRRRLEVGTLFANDLARCLLAIHRDGAFCLEKADSQRKRGIPMARRLAGGYDGRNNLDAGSGDGLGVQSSSHRAGGQIDAQVRDAQVGLSSDKAPRKDPLPRHVRARQAVSPAREPGTGAQPGSVSKNRADAMHIRMTPRPLPTR